MSGFVPPRFALLAELREFLGDEAAGRLLAGGSFMAHVQDIDGRFIPIGPDEWTKPGARGVLSAGEIKAGRRGTRSWGGLFLQADDQPVTLFITVEDLDGRHALLAAQAKAEASTGSGATPSASQEVSLGTRERRTLLRLVLGMAMDGYGYDPRAPKSPIPGQIAAHLETRGLSVTDETVKKWLKAAYDEGVWDEASDTLKPNSV